MRATESRIKQDRPDIRQQIGGDIDRRGDQHGRFNHRNVTQLQGIDEQAPEPGIAEDLLHNDDTADQISQVEGGDIQCRHQRIGECVAQQHPAP